MQKKNYDVKPLSIETKSLLVRALKKEDQSLWQAWETESKQNNKDFLHLLQQNKELAKHDLAYHLAIFQKNSAGNLLLANLNISSIVRDPLHSCALYLSSYKQLGDQILLETLAAGFHILFNDLDLHRCEVLLPKKQKWVHPSLLLKVGMAVEGVRKKALHHEGAWMDCDVYSLVKEDWLLKHIDSLLNASVEIR